MKQYKNFKMTGLILGLILVLNSGIASASFLVEPHVGYNIHASDKPSSVEYSWTGPEYGLKAGYQNLGFMVGLDYTRSTMELEQKVGSASGKSDMSRNEIGIFAGYNFPILLRAWVGYYFKNKMEFTSSGNYYEGNTKELGVGFTALPFLSVNLMLRMVSYDEYNGAALPNKIEPTEIVLGVSLPLTL